ncbi:CDP-glycerol glycerophosphotransferase family protein [uncultured Jatrophihabitans sp.]|uniref:bifunctional glycosyltransferase/CDP-glycerol:glycerophosphate glycerophosphotransferase n=1 Tax=uncultured Jatrophihabitans sp. TaxID=1610747 RepID=UPI0035C9815D
MVTESAGATPTGSERNGEPFFSLVVPMYDIGRYLPAFLASLDEQSTGLADVELIFVDDGSPDDSAAIAERWLRTSHANGRLIRKPNGGSSEARNVGVAAARGQWLTFPDPDDVLSPNYFAAVSGFLTSAEAADVYLVCANLILLDDVTGQLRDKHPLRHKFARGRRVVDLTDSPTDFHLQSASAFYRRGPIADARLTFDDRVRPNFEDGHFTARYLDLFDRPRVALLPEAEYRYRQREDGSSLVQGSWRKPEKYDDLLRYGYLSLLDDLSARHGSVPLWAQTMIVYDLAFFFRHDSRPNSPTAGITAAQSERFWDLYRQVMRHIDLATIESYDVVWLSDEVRTAMIVGGKDAYVRPSAARVDIRDPARRLVRAWYYYAGEAPAEVWRSGGQVVQPVFGKHRPVRFLGRTVMRQRIAWLPADATLALELAGAATPLLIGGARDALGARAAEATPRDLKRVSTKPNPVHGPVSTPVRTPFRQPGAGARDQVRDLTARVRPAARERVNRAKAAMLRRYARSAKVRAEFADCWLLIDRDTQAQDNAERLYEHLRAHHPEVNAWFVLDRDSPDWDRLAKAGFKLIAHRTRRHTLALLNCRHLVSSQIDHYIVAPLPARRFNANWHYTFLQHGVTKDDLSTWINSKPIELMITVTPDEHESIVGEALPYRFTEREVKLTGFPRHDRLLALGERVPADGRRLVLITPTWRRELLRDTLGRSNQRTLRDDFWHSEYARQWRAVIESEQLHAVAGELGWEIVFLPHPNMADYLDDSPLGDHVTVRRYADVDIQQLLARTGVLVTDYSSMAFEAAYLQRPVVYFQFDRAEFFSGAHAYRRGTWSYETAGFGPVVDTDAAAVTAIAQLMADGPAPEHARRMAETFALRDGQCARRTYEAIRAIEQPLPRPAAEPLAPPTPSSGR